MAIAVATLRGIRPAKGLSGGFRPLKAFRLAFQVIMNLSLVAAVAMLFFLAIGPRVLNYRTETMLTGSMVPYINPGDVTVVRPEPISAIRVGQVITFQAPLADRRIVSHRVISVVHQSSGGALIRTKGDANAVADPWTAQIQPGTEAWRVVAVVPHLGDLIRALHSRLLRMLSIWAIPATLAIAMLVRIWKPRGAKA